MILTKGVLENQDETALAEKIARVFSGVSIEHGTEPVPESIVSRIFCRPG